MPETPAGEQLYLDVPGVVDSERGRFAYQSAEKINRVFDDQEIRVSRDQAAFDADRELARRHVEEEHAQRLRFIEEIHAVTLQSLAASNTATTVADAALVDSLVGIIDKLTSLVPPATTGRSSKA